MPGRRVRRGTSARRAKPQEVPRPVQGGRYSVRVAPPGTTYGDVPAEPGRIITLDVRANPERAARMIDLGYIEAFDGKAFACRACGGEFATDRQRQAHGHRVHEPEEDPVDRALRGRAQELRATSRRRALTFEEQAELTDLETRAGQMLEARDRAEEKAVASPHMDRTAASRA